MTLDHPLPHLRAIIFDVDGTLAETEELHREAFNRAFEQFDLDWYWDASLYKKLLRVTGGKERIRYYAESQSAAEFALVEPLVETMHRTKNEKYAQALAAGALKLRPGIRRLIDQARLRGVSLAIATTTSRENVEALLRAALPLGEATFDVIVAGDEVARKKPDPAVYIETLRRLGLDANGCIAVEDSRNGVAAALAAGLKVIVTPSLYSADEDFSGALAVVSELGETDRPCRYLAGLHAESNMIDCDLLDRWIAHAD